MEAEAFFCHRKKIIEREDVLISKILATRQLFQGTDVSINPKTKLVQPYNMFVGHSDSADVRVHNL